ncbi:MAG: hypothetical protein OXH86_07195 [Acidimicrobiaceae bacterium]|nr:hypothetical protein [Acidimicrobiaceae bacterium]
MAGDADDISIPPGLLFAVASRAGRISMVLGAGCSLEAPTSLKLSSELSFEVHTALLADGVLADGECMDPQDLSELAEVVHNKTGSQREVVNRLPASAFRLARANRGYLLAVALMLEGSVSCIATLNYDLALTDALRQLGADDVAVVVGPASLPAFGSKAVIYLHRNVDEQDPERWILRREALETEWESSWEELVANRISASPVLVFAGLGSPAKVLTRSVERVRGIVADVPDVYLVDPTEDTPFAADLSLPDDNLVRAGWTAFMERLADRVAHECCEALRAEARRIAEDNGWSIESSSCEQMIDAVQRMGLLSVGKVRAKWLGVTREYRPASPESTASLAYLVLVMGHLLNEDYLSLRITLDGLVEITSRDEPVRHAMGIHGGGVHSWATAEQLADRVLVETDPLPDLVMAGGFTGTPLRDLAPPTDIVSGSAEDDIVTGWQGPKIVDAELEMAQGRSFVELVA